jgi:hypothetical protein
MDISMMTTRTESHEKISSLRRGHKKDLMGFALKQALS